MTARLLMIALDAADGRLLDEWTISGALPNLAALRARGAMRRLTAPFGVTDDGLWGSFQYGVPVGEHGRYHYRLRLAGGKLGMAHLEEGDRDAFWVDLSRRGQRVAVIDVPKCPRPRPLNGIHLVDWLVHGRYFSEPLSYPGRLASEIVARFGPAPPSRCDYRQEELGDDDVREIVGNLRVAVSQKRAAGLHCLAAEPWDLFVIGFKEAHCAGHGLFDLFEGRHPGYDPARSARLGEPVRRIFVDLDAAIGDLTACAGSSAEVVVFSTSDIEPNGSLDHLMPEVVERLNRCLADRHAKPVVRLIGALPGGWAAKAMRYCEVLPYNENFGAMRVYRKGPTGGSRERLIQEIEAMLGELVDAETGQSVVASTARPSSEFEGARAAALPDILIHYATGVFPRTVQASWAGRIAADTPRMRPGNHAGGGLLIAAGEVVTRSLGSVNAIEDLAPLAAKVLGVEGARPTDHSMNAASRR